MSRFSGWTAAAVEKLGKIPQGNNDSSYVKNYVPELCKKYVKKESPDYCGRIVSALQVLKIPSVREYKFLHDRRFKFDIAIPEHKIAIEFEGGIFKQGRHTRGAGYSSDAKKYNLAVMHGWKLLRYTTDRTNKLNWEFEIADEVRKLITKRDLE
jgi:very-short-patch-repair endonuclease